MNGTQTRPPLAGAAVDERTARSERFRNWAAGWFHLTTIVAILVGAIWALIEFSKLLQAETAAAQVAALESQAMLNLHNAQGRPSLRLDLEVQQLTRPSDPKAKRLLAVTVYAENPGTEATRMTLPEGTPLRVTRISETRRDGTFRRGTTSLGRTNWYIPRDPAPREGAATPAPERVVHDAEKIVPPGGRSDLSFLVEVPGPGTYHASFVALPAPLDQPRHGGSEGRETEGATGASEPPTYWTTTRYFVVD